MYFQTLQLEQSELVSQVDQVRDSAVDLMSKSDKYHQLVEPELTRLNQRWVEITDTLKVGGDH